MASRGLARGLVVRLGRAEEAVVAREARGAADVDEVRAVAAVLGVADPGRLARGLQERLGPEDDLHAGGHNHEDPLEDQGADAHPEHLPRQVVRPLRAKACVGVGTTLVLILTHGLRGRLLVGLTLALAAGGDAAALLVENAHLVHEVVLAGLELLRRRDEPQVLGVGLRDLPGVGPPGLAGLLGISPAGFDEGHARSSMRTAMARCERRAMKT